MRHRLRFVLTALRALVVLSALVLAGAPAAGALHVRGKRLLEGRRVVQLRGVDFSGAEYACIQGYGIWDNPKPDARQARLIRSWGANAVRVPLNEDCWLGLYTKAAYAGANYRRAITRAVGTFHRAGLYVILDLHWSAPGTQRATKQLPLPDADHTPAFWRSVARRFRTDHRMVFDLFNEPFGTAGWRCWRRGCTTGGYRTAGMQTLVNAVRSTGARQPLMLGGYAYSNDLSGWLAHLPRDPQHALVASFHLYNFNECIAAVCWNRVLVPIARRHPVITGELGEDDCRSTFIEPYVNWADAHGVSYLGWAWDPWGCGSGPSLISDDNGTPTPFGAGLRRHLLARRGR